MDIRSLLPDLASLPPLTVVGAGSVFATRYVPALRHLGLGTAFDLGHVIDIRSQKKVRQQLDALGLQNVQYHRMTMGTQDELQAALVGPASNGGPILIATPGPSHVDHILAGMATGRVVAIEKPLTTSARGHGLLAGTFGAQGVANLFTFGYYLQEKALPLLLLARSGNVPAGYHSFVDGVRLSEWRRLRERLGRVRNVYGMLVEGEDARTWPITPNGGGHALETFSHLVALASLWVSGMRLEWVKAGRFAGHSTGSAESLVAVRLGGSDGVQASLLMAKYAPQAVCGRWLCVEFEHGRAFMDLESEMLTVVHRDTTVYARVERSLKYVPQFVQLFRQLYYDERYCELEAGMEAVQISLRAREAGACEGLISYTDTDVEELLVTKRGVFADVAQELDSRLFSS